MSVSCDIIVGYSIDIMDELSKLSGEARDNLLDVSEQDIDYVSNYSSDDMVDKVTVVYDGMDNDYCKLIYVKAVEKYSECYMEQSTIDSVNELLDHAVVPFHVKQKIKDVYKRKFNRELSGTSKIRADFVVHMW